MAGHSKWANIKHRKAGQDARRGKIFTKLIREITVAAKIGGPDSMSNPRLRTAVDKALTQNMTRDTISRAIQRGTGGEDGANMETILYEGYGPGGTALLVECLTDNRNRTVSEVRYAFSKCGGNLGTEGSVAYLFDKKGVISLAAGLDEEAITLESLEAGAEDLLLEEDGTLIVTALPENFETVQRALVATGWQPDAAEITMVASNHIQLDKESEFMLLRLIDLLEDLDDVQEVHHNGLPAEGEDDADSR